MCVSLKIGRLSFQTQHAGFESSLVQLARVPVQREVPGEPADDRPIVWREVTLESGSHGYTYNINSGTSSADINDPNAVSTVAAAINNSGEIAGFYTDSGGVIHGFLDNQSQFTTVNAPGASETQLLGINDSGIAVGFDVVNGAMHGIIFNSHADKFTTLDDPNGIGIQH